MSHSGTDCEVYKAQRSTEGKTNLSDSAEPALDGSWAEADVTEQLPAAADTEADDKDVDIMSDSSDDIGCASPGASKAISQDDVLHDSEFQHNNSTEKQHNSSAAKISSNDSVSTLNTAPGEAENAVVTRRDILLRAVLKRKRDIAESAHFMDGSLGYLNDSSKVSRNC